MLVFVLLHAAFLSGRVPLEVARPAAQRDVVPLALIPGPVPSDEGDDQPLVLPDFSPARRYTPLSGAFVPPADEDERLDLKPRGYQLRRRTADDENGVDDMYEREGPWSDRSTKQRAMWADPERRAQMLAKRRATIAAKRAREGLPPPEARKAVLDATAQKRSDALKLRFADEEAWMERRLEAGSELRARRDNEEYKRERQRQRSEVARARAAARKAKAAAAAEGAKANTDSDRAVVDGVDGELTARAGERADTQ
jgi:hypothetical protein